MKIESGAQGLPAALGERFEEVEPLSVGRVSTIYRARWLARGTVVALRVLHPHAATNEAVRKRFQRELAAVRRLDHESILKSYDWIEEDGVSALVMEYVEGRTLRELVRDEGALVWERAANILEQVARGLEHAHQRGVMHRDLSAEHVMVDGADEVKIVGFGLARVEELVGLTMHTRVLGAIEAMAPERMLGLSYDGRADIYSLGVIGRELVTGRAPEVSGYGFSQALLGGEGEEDGAGLAWPEEVPAQGRQALARAMARDASVRFATVEQFLRALGGDYDRGLWEGWASRETRSCPKCGAAVLEGLDRCVECDFRFRRLVQNPGAGTWAVRVLSEADVFEKDVWFEVNSASRSLTEEQFQKLMVYLDQYDDTTRFADGHPYYLTAPYNLFVELEKEEAERIAEELGELGLIVRVERAWQEREIESANERARWGKVVKGAMDLAPEVMLQAMVAGFAFAMSPWLFVMTVVVSGVMSYGLRQWFKPPEEVMVGRRGDASRSREAMIPTESLSGVGWVERGVMPEKTGEVMKRLKDRGLRRDIHEALTLALGLKRRHGGISSEEIRAVLAEILSIGEKLQVLETERSKGSTAELIGELEVAEERLKEAESAEASARWIEERARVLGALDRRDEVEEERVVLQAAFLQVRGELLEKASYSREQEVESQEGEDVMLELASLLGAVREVEEVVEEAL